MNSDVKQGTNNECFLGFVLKTGSNSERHRKNNELILRDILAIIKSINNWNLVGKLSELEMKGDMYD